MSFRDGIYEDAVLMIPGEAMDVDWTGREIGRTGICKLLQMDDVWDGMMCVLRVA